MSETITEAEFSDAERAITASLARIVARSYADMVATLSVLDVKREACKGCDRVGNGRCANCGYCWECGCQCRRK